MAAHKPLFDALTKAIKEGKRKDDVPRITGGSVNYRMMAAATACIVRPEEPDYQKAFIDLLDRQEQEGHLTLKGPNGVACEQGSPGMHWTFNCAPVVGVLKWAIPRGQDQVRRACVRWIANEAGLDRPYRFLEDGVYRVYIPAPRVKNEKKQGPVDGYRDVFLSLALGEPVKRSRDYWDKPEALAVKTFRDVLPKLTEAERRQIQNAPLPKLYVPIKKNVLSPESYLLELTDTPKIREDLGRGVCHWVQFPSEGKVTWGYNWEPRTGQETA